MPGFRIFLTIGFCVAVGLGLSACTTAGNEVDQSLALTETADLALPDSVSVLPSSGAPMMMADAGSEPRQAADKSSQTAMVALEAEPEARLASNEPELKPAAYAKADAPRGDVQDLIAKYAAMYEVPVDLVRSVAKRESNFRPTAYNNGHWGLMQIKHATARGMGYNGPARGLLDAETNLKYSVKYLRGAWMVADGNHKLADRLYQRGYYYDAKRKGMLEATGLGKDRRRRRANPGA